MTHEITHSDNAPATNMSIWDKLCRPPTTALKPITAGRLKGKSDINPQWRMKAITEQFGPCGTGWKYTIDKLWSENGDGVQMASFALISLFYKVGEHWSEAVPGIGGSMLIEQESKGPHTSDEAYKMAVTDALSVAMKSIGMAAEVYLGNWDGSKFVNQKEEVENVISETQVNDLFGLITEVQANEAQFCKYFQIAGIACLPESKYNLAVKMLEAKRGA